MPGAHRRAAPLPLAGYAFVREITDAPLRPDQAQLLLQAQQVVDDTRATLHHGRGNVTTDIARTQGNATARSIAARTALQQMPPLVEGISRHALLTRMAQASAAAAFAGAGRCGEHARVAVAMSAPHLGRSDSVTLVEHFAKDHSWVAINRETSEGTGDVEAIADAWAEGPAFLAEDGKHTREERGDVETTSLKAGEVQVVRRVHDFVLGELPTGAQRDATVRQLAEQGRQSGQPEPRLWPPTAALSARRVMQAQERHAALQSMAPDLTPSMSERIAARADVRLGTPEEVAQARAADVVQAGLSLPVASRRAVR